MKTADLTFQELSIKDLAEILRIVTEIQQRQIPGFFWNELDLKAELQIAKAFGCFSAERGASSSLDEKNLNSGQLYQVDVPFLCGFILVRAVDEKLWDITLLGVDPAFWGQGLMKFVLQAWLQTIPTPCEVWLEVHSQNHQAVSFYQKLGFLVTGRRSHYYRDGGDALLMVLKQT